MKFVQGTKYLWKMPDEDTSLLPHFASTYNLSYPIIQTLITRQYKSKSDLDSYIICSGEQNIHDPALLADAEKAVDRIIYAIKNQEKILICGDYDVDGITSSAMMMLCLLPLDAKINFFLPNRVRDGYGLSVKTIRRAALNGYKLIITVDNGITAFEPAIEAKKHGIDLIVTDHHKPHAHLPDAFAVIDPYRSDCKYPYKKLAGVGVSFKILSLLYSKLGLQLPKKVYELLMLGTVADVVPLTGENRYWVRYGLALANSTESLSMSILRENARITKAELSSTDVGFFITPQINALGRLEDPREGVAFLIGQDFFEVKRVGNVLKELNQARRAIEKTIFQDIENSINNKIIDIENESIVVAVGDWQPGVIGLVASRIVSTYARPAIVFHAGENGIAKGSCRSVAEFSMFDALTEAKDILINFGGHAMAAGLSLDMAKIPELKSILNSRFSRLLPDFDFKNKLYIDAHLPLAEFNKKIMLDLAYLEPFGCENPQPVFYTQGTIIDSPTMLKDNHVKCLVFAEGIIKPVIFFNRPDLYEILNKNKDKEIKIAGHVMENNWNNKVSIEFQGLDILI